MTPERLREIPLFATLSDQELADLQTTLQQKTYPPHSVIFWMDEPGDQLYVIERGQVRISHTDKEGKERTLATLGEGAFFGELSLLDGGPHTGTARTNTESILLTIDRAAFYNFLDKHPQFSRTLLAVITDRLRTSTDNIRSGANHHEQPAVQKDASFRQLVDRAARRVTSSGFLVFAILFMLAWIGFQTWYYYRHHGGTVSLADNPPTFFFLGFLLTLTSFLLTILVLTSQRGLADRDRIRAEIEYQVNLKAQAEVMRLQLKMDEVLKLLEKQKETKPAKEQEKKV